MITKAALCSSSARRNPEVNGKHTQSESTHHRLPVGSGAALGEIQKEGLMPDCKEGPGKRQGRSLAWGDHRSTEASSVVASSWRMTGDLDESPNSEASVFTRSYSVLG